MGDYFVGALHARDRVRYGQTQGPDTGKGTNKGPEAESDIAGKNYEAYVRAKENGHDDWVKIARKCDNYFVGEQWEQDITDQLDQEGRPHVTVNQVLSTVNAILSEHVRTRQEITFSPSGKGASEPVALALSKVVHQVQNNNKSRWVEQQVVADGIIEDRGYFDMRIDFSDNIMGEVREIALDPRDVLLDPGAKEYDPSTWTEVTRTRWMTPDQVAVFYGEEKAEMLRSRSMAQRLSSDSIEWDTGTRTFGDDEEHFSFTYQDEDLRAVKRVRIIERQYKKYTRCKYFVDPLEGDMRKVPTGWDEVRAASFALTYGLEILEKPELRIRWTTSADDVLLYDDWSLYNRFTIIPFFPYFRRGKPTGLVRHLLSPQDMLNKITSQELHVVNTTANSGWIFESGSLVNMDADDLEQVGAKTGLVLEFKRGSTPPEKIQPNTVPTGLDNIATKAMIYFRNVSGIPETMVGQQSREISGVAIDNMNASGAGSLEIVWDNLAKTRQYRADFMLELIQQWYTERRVMQITTMNIDGGQDAEELVVNDDSGDGDILNNLALGEYTVTVSSQKSRDSTMDTEFAQIMQMREAGIAIPDWAAVRVSRLEDKEEIVEVMKKIQGMAEPTPEEVEFQLKQQDLALRMQEATLMDLISASRLKDAQATQAMAKADAEGQALMAEMQKEGARMRTELERMRTELQSTREELAVRLQVAREKNETTRFNTMASGMQKRLDTLMKRQTDLAQIAAKARADEKKAQNDAIKARAAARKPAAKKK